MDTRLSFFVTIHFSLLLFCFASSPLSFCHEKERSALLEFKKTFFHKTSCFGDYESKKFESWKLGAQSRNCCAWDGIECDKEKGYVIGVELSGTCLSGCINSNTTLFHLVHLQRLDLSENELEGQVPPEILKLNDLRSLDLSFNYKLRLGKPDLLDFMQNFTKLESLNLSWVNISAPIPNILANSSSLRSLTLSECNLQGEFPPTIFEMPKLEFLDVWENYQLSGHLPEFHSTSSLKLLHLSYTNFSGQLPSSLGQLSNLSSLYLISNKFTGEIPSSIVNLTQLNELDLSNNHFSGQIPTQLTKLTQLKRLDLSYNHFSGRIPTQLTNLTQLKTLHLSSNHFSGHFPTQLTKLTQLNTLDLSSNHFSGHFPTQLTQLTQLNTLDLRDNNFSGDIPTQLTSLTQLNTLDLSSNHFSGHIPTQLANLTQLSYVDLSFNNFSGPIPILNAKLKDLLSLNLQSNNLNGTIRIDMFSMLKNLHTLVVSFNKLSFVEDSNKTYASPPKFLELGLASCNLNSFPTFLQHQDRLESLDLSSNDISGEIPEWFLEMNIDSMKSLILSNNSLTSSVDSPLNFRWKGVDTIDLRDNNLKGSVPIPSPSVISYLVSRNELSGNLPSQICEARYIESLDFSTNNLKGALPLCLNNLSSTLLHLSLHDNNFTGEISLLFDNEYCSLEMIDLSSNQFHGSLPRSLKRCHELKFLNLGNNHIKDVFPFWLGSLRNLRVLVLHSNKFDGAVGEPETIDDFPSLQIVDLSSNNFQNCLPSMYFERWQAMKLPSSYQEGYMQGALYQNGSITPAMFEYTVKIFIKGLKLSYPKIQNYLTFIDLSSNHFSCGIPSTIESLVQVQYLNLSNNNLIGPVPSFLKALTQLQSLDLSQNKLHGKIPQELTQLTFLEKFNVSYNNLSGKIPEGRQFDTFTNDSFFGNMNLCGSPLSKECSRNGEFPPALGQSPEGEESIEIDWRVVLMGYGSGLIIGVVIGQRFTTKPARWMFKYNRRARMQ